MTAQLDDATTPAASLAGYQRRYLRGLAHALKPIVQVGRDGVTESVIAAADGALDDHELIKVQLREPDDKRALAAELAAATQAHLCGLVGHVVILYRAHAERPRIELPQRLTT